MKNAFIVGTFVRFNCENGAKAKILRYDVEGFYHVEVEGRPGVVIIAHEKDMVLDDEELVRRLDVSRCEPHFVEVVQFAKTMNRWHGKMGLRENLERLVNIAGRDRRPVLFKDFAPYSFEWSAGGMHGGLIFHGKHDGGGNGSAPTFSVSLEPCDGWSLHT